MNTNRMIKIDLHSHSTHSPDGGISENEYLALLEHGIVNSIAITDHNRIDFAQYMNATYGSQFIIGEEIMTNQGEVIGLYLNECVPPFLNIHEAIASIRRQGGLVYIPHAFDRWRKGIQKIVADAILIDVDIIEIFNPRNITLGGNREMAKWGKVTSKAMAASSDAHCHREVGHSYSLIKEQPTQSNLVTQLQHASYVTRYASLRHFFCPMLNKMHNNRNTAPSMDTLS